VPLDAPWRHGCRPALDDDQYQARRERVLSVF
jgi:hypothetical protein